MTNEEMAKALRVAGYHVSAPVFVGSAEEAVRTNKLIDANGFERPPGANSKTGEYSTAQMLHDEIFGGDPNQPLFD